MDCQEAALALVAATRCPGNPGLWRGFRNGKKNKASHT